jgi:hypothetical protein
MGRRAQDLLTQPKKSTSLPAAAPSLFAPCEHSANVKTFLCVLGKLCVRLATVGEGNAAHELSKEDVCCVPATGSLSGLRERASCRG